MKTQAKENLSKNIRTLADKRSIGINALADAAKVSRSHLYEVLSAKKSPTVDWLNAVAPLLRAETFRLLRK